jgi:hypothetical protein
MTPDKLNDIIIYLELVYYTQVTLIALLTGFVIGYIYRKKGSEE